MIRDASPASSRATVFLAVLLLISANTLALGAGRLNVVATTTLLRSAAVEVGGERVDVSVIIKPGSCPGHFDVRPNDIKALAASGLVLYHGYETFVPKLVSSMGEKRPKLVRVREQGSWMLPHVYIRGAREVAKALCEVDPAGSGTYKKSLARLERDVKKFSESLRKRPDMKRVKGAKVMCSDMQRDVLEWMGCDVVATFGRAEDFSPSGQHRLRNLGRKRKVKLVVDNLQSGPSAGKELARDIGAAHVTLTSFPGAFPNTNSWRDCLADTLRRVAKGVQP